MSDEITIEEIDNILDDNALTLSTDVKKLSLETSPLSNRQLLHILQRTPKKHVYQRPAKGGGTWDYVTGTYVKKVLNYVFGWMWDFQIVDKGVEGDCLWVQGRLTVRNTEGQPMIVKEQFGRADLKKKKDGTGYLDYGNDLKAASTDALKKCASELGIASDIYGKNEFVEIAPEVKKELLEDNSPATENQIEIIKNLYKTKNISDGTVATWCKRYGSSDKLENISKSTAIQVIKELTQ